MKKTLIALFLIVPGLVLAANYVTKNGDTIKTVASKTCITVTGIPDSFLNLKLTSGQSVNSLCVPTPPPTTVPPPAGEVGFDAYLTSYTYWDNTPPGSADIALPVLHSKAGGTGTYADPITIAVGHSITNGVDTPDYPKGTIFYIPNVRKYFIVEDLCGDGSKPQNGPCHTGFPAGASAWLDMWIDGQSTTSSKATSCANALTKVLRVEINPAPYWIVVPGPVINNGVCATQYGDVLLGVIQ